MTGCKRFLQRSHGFLRQSAGFCTWGSMLLLSQAAWAQACTTSAVAPAFGNYVATGNPGLANGSLTVSCSVLGSLRQDIFYTVKLSFGNQAQGTQRRMASGANRLNYNLYCDSGYNNIWGDGTSSTCTNMGGQSGLLGQLVASYPIHGRMPVGQYVVPGTYNDSITIQILY